MFFFVILNNSNHHNNCNNNNSHVDNSCKEWHTSGWPSTWRNESERNTQQASISHTLTHVHAHFSLSGEGFWVVGRSITFLRSSNRGIFVSFTNKFLKKKGSGGLGELSGTGKRRKPKYTKNGIENERIKYFFFSFFLFLSFAVCP